MRFPESVAIQPDPRLAIAKCFAGATAGYEQHALVQHRAADHLMNQVADRRHQIPAGAVLELGCGTGYLTRRLAALYPERRVFVTDLVPEMVAVTQKQVALLLPGQAAWCYGILDAGAPQAHTGNPALILSGMTFQWVPNLPKVLAGWLEKLQYGGWLVISVPLQTSFREWKDACKQSTVPFTGYPLPELAHLERALRPLLQIWYAERITYPMHYDRPLAFLHSMKNIGAHYDGRHSRLKPAQLRRLDQAWKRNAQSEITVSYDIGFILMQKRG